ncbi:hypothetical protein AMAG_06751 [Allomyces macrogynus ATCC 38327]|uniref:Endoplasmic reticulum vesicle transporter C-terminal domain-containing protein n=1 Tax=Allomyces macrogynus (strain ATCC 38327) TaxID=578462 RepID=A0A0L0SEX8_ALLM3|nr:hypothetical protein AMAG_06751 [Allomyces macrogynus ATCC 38327]|eukprot:KNE60987.1 hypothetical protein AMAG_06751 [Allomyces macrogynus ATCC 38327]
MLAHAVAAAQRRVSSAALPSPTTPSSQQRKAAHKLAAWDAFAKVDDAFLDRSSARAWTSMVVAVGLVVLVGMELWRATGVHVEHAFTVDNQIRMQVPVFVDVTVAMPCEYLSVDVLDAAGVALHVGNTVQQLPVCGVAVFTNRLLPDPLNNDRAVRDVGKTPFDRSAASSHSAATVPGSACRIFGSFTVAKLSGNLHITAAGHGYAGTSHAPHAAINFTHRIDQLAFGTPFDAAHLLLANPLTHAYEVAESHFDMFQYFVSVVPTVFRSHSGAPPVVTHQYAVTDSHKVVGATDPRSGQAVAGVPGVFFRYDWEALAVEVTAVRNESLARFLVRMCAIVGGGYVCAGMAHAAVAWAVGIWNDVGRHRSVRI